MRNAARAWPEEALDDDDDDDKKKKNGKYIQSAEPTEKGGRG